MGDECQICGYKRSLNALELHHINPQEKEFIFDRIRSWDKNMEELKKCILVCANCHREIHVGLITEELLPSFNEDRASEVTEQIKRLKTHQDKYCLKCGAVISSKATYCQKCDRELKRTVERPSRTELKNLIRNTPMTQIGAMFGVTDNAIRKWCKAYDLPSKKSEINVYTDEEWEKI